MPRTNLLSIFFSFFSQLLSRSFLLIFIFHPFSCYLGVIKVGDRLRLDVQNYRPEKILFARAVKLKTFRKLGRETGVVCGVRDQGFGLVRSNAREYNIFFRLSDVITEGGVAVQEGQVVMGSCLSFDVMEENRGVPNTKLRAVRVQLMPPNSVSFSNNFNGNGNGMSNGSNVPLSMEGLNLRNMDNTQYNPQVQRVSPISMESDHNGITGFTLLQVF